MLALVRRMGFALLVVSVAAGLTGCSGSAVTTTSSPPLAGIVDPLTTVTDKKSSEFVAAHLSPIVHRGGTGTTVYKFDVSQGKGSVRSYLACAPAGDFRVTVAGKSYWGTCDRQFTSKADLPVVVSRPRTESAKVTVAAGTHFEFLLIRTPTS